MFKCLVWHAILFVFLAALSRFLKGECQDENRRKGKTRHKALVTIKSNVQNVKGKLTFFEWQDVVKLARLYG